MEKYSEARATLLELIQELNEEQCSALYDAALLTKETSTDELNKLVSAFYVASILMQTSLETIRRYARTAKVTAGIKY